jgi:ankyrin repeat protein
LIHANFPVVRHILENFAIDPRKTINLNLAAISSEILSDKAQENRDVYLDAEFPMIILAAIGGDIDIFSFLIERGCNVNSTAHITLSKKNRNSVVSNVLGAAAYYGRVDLVNFILDKYKKVEANFRCTEKKSKIKINLQNKEFTDFTPLHLAVVSEAPEDYSIHAIKLLHKSGANFDATDFAMNNVLHLAVKFNKLNILKFLVDKLNLYNEGINKEGHTPVGIASELGNQSICEYLQSYSNRDSNVDDLLNELEQGKKKKQPQKKKKKEAKDEILLGSTEYEETFKIKPKAPKEVKKEPEPEPEPEIEDYEEQEVDEEVNEGKRPYERRSYYKDNYYYDNSYYNKGGYGEGNRKYDYNNDYNNDYYDNSGHYEKQDGYGKYEKYDKYDRYGNYKSGYGRNKGYSNDQYNRSNNEDTKKYKEESVVSTTETPKPVENIVTNTTAPSTNAISATPNNVTATKPYKSQIVGLNVKSKKKPHHDQHIVEAPKIETHTPENMEDFIKPDQPEEIVHSSASQKHEGLNDLKKGIYSTESYDDGDEHFLTEEDIGGVKAPLVKNPEHIVEEVSEEVSEEIKPSIDFRPQQDELTQKQLSETLVISK